MLTSARNRFDGNVASIKFGAVNDEVQVEIAGGEIITAIITHESVERLGLKNGAAVIAIVKASSVIVGIPDGTPMKLSARNALPGKVEELTTGAVNTEVIISLRGGTTLTAIITNKSA